MMWLWVVVFFWMSKLGILTMVAFGSEASGNLLQARKRVKQHQAAKSKGPLASYQFTHTRTHILYIYIHTPVIPPVIPSLKSWVLSHLSHGTINPTPALRPAPCAMFLHLGILLLSDLADLAEGGLFQSRWQRVPTGAVEPQGWLKMQMTLRLACTRAY